jgi:hypothetical protein
MKRFRISFRIGAALAAAAVIVGFLTAPAYAQKARKQDSTDPTPAETAQFLAEVAKLVHRSSEGLKVRQLTDGTKFIDLEDRYQNVVLAKVNADGTITTECVSTSAEARQFVTKGAKSTEKPAEKKSQGTAPAMEVE